MFPVLSNCSLSLDSHQFLTTLFGNYKMEIWNGNYKMEIWNLVTVQHAAAAVKSLQSCPTLCDPIDPPGFPVPGILQARTLEWAAISFSNAWKWKVKVKSLSHVRL